MLLVSGLSAIYIIPNFKHGDSGELLPASRNKFRHAELIGPNKVAEMEIDKQNKLEDLKRHAKQQLDNIMVSSNIGREKQNF